MRFTRSTAFTIHTLALIFFPGVLIHELGHFFMANILFVPTGEIEFLPKVQEGGIKLGSVTIASTDPFRRFLIGVAPVISGIGILLLASFYLTPLWPLSWKTAVFIYILFEIGNTMFSSKKDLEGAIGLLAFIVFFTLCFFILGGRIPQQITDVTLHIASLQTFKDMGLWLSMSAFVNLLLWMILKGFVRR